MSMFLIGVLPTIVFTVATTAYHVGHMRALAFAFETIGDADGGEECRSLANRSCWRGSLIIVFIATLIVFIPEARQ